MLSALSRDYSATLSVNWIINRRMDLTWFIGAALSGYALFFMHAGLGWDMVRIWFLWVVFLDSPHLFGTFSRTYLDKREFQQRRTLLTWSRLWFLAGPAMILLAAIGSGRVMLGLFTVVVFSLGFASVLVIVGVVAARVGQIVLTWLAGRWVAWVQSGAALLIVAVGVVLTVAAWRTLARLS